MLTIPSKLFDSVNREMCKGKIGPNILKYQAELLVKALRLPNPMEIPGQRAAEMLFDRLNETAPDEGRHEEIPRS